MSDQSNNAHSPRASGLHIDMTAPAFTARTTHGVRSLSDYSGQWLILFSHTADFTPVCTSEFLAFERRAKDFRAKNCELLGLSIDSVFSHKAWVDSINAHFNVEISFPIVEDVSMSIAHDYGMIHEGSVSTATVRSVFFIDPKGVLRALIHYPASVGRSVDEIFRALVCLQQADETQGVVLPEGWIPGKKVLLEPTQALEAANDTSDGLWYYQERDLGAVDVPA